ncbi:OmpA family protein [Thalassotalea psychrophila]|uniref:OmpA family protein n=1 Tax=Thalassotalea psychrophila TaxID=3065647 RepID=A0ABY9TQA5_9GAMM|nr:OmpA family protein [Colwelliaceae bacterium SQ149]
MRFTLSSLFKKANLASLSLLFIASTSQAQDITIDLASPSSAWKEIMKGSTFDPNGDTQAGASGVELVGDDVHSVLSTLYDEQATENDDSDDEIAYRIRIGDDKDTAVYIIGIDANLDGEIDLFLAANTKAKDQVLQFYSPGNKSNTSPSTTSIAQSNYEISLDQTNYNFSSVESIETDSPDGLIIDIGNNGQLDHFVSFVLPFDDLKNQIFSASGINITKNSVMQYILLSLTQTNALNGDFGGIDDKVDDWDATYENLGMFSDPLSLSNLAPKITNNAGADTSTISIYENITAVVDIDATDAENDSIVYSISGGADAALFSIDDSSGELSFKIAPDFETPSSSLSSNAYVVQVSASDGALNDSQTITVNIQDVNEGGGNLPPSISGNPLTTIAENSDYSFVPSSSDPDQDIISFAIINKPSWAIFDDITGELNGTPSFTDAGLYSDIEISVSDDDETVALPAFSITVTETNQAPTISGTPVTVIAENDDYYFKPNSDDLDNDTLTFNIINMPSWATFDETTGELIGTPNFTHAGLYSDIEISVSDNSSTANLTTFDITVINTNQPPTISGIAVSAVAENSYYSFTPTSDDLDNDPLSFAIINKPDWATFETSTGKISGTPSFTDAGTYSGIIISVDDDSEIVSLPAFSIEVTNTNRAPIANSQSIDVVENIAKFVTLSGIDDDSDTLSYLVITQPDSGSLFGNIPNLTYTPDTDFTGTDSFSFKVNDGSADSPTVTITINVLADLDGDGIPDVTDNDTDGDGIDNATEGNGDTDGDSIPDYLDEDADNDGIPDSEEGINDTDQDGTPDYLDSSIDEDDDGIPDIIEGINDSDNDAIPDYLDADSDNDGITDTAESNATGMDSDNDGIDDVFDVDQTNGVDSNGDGIDDDIISQDSDDDGLADRIDTDSDNDGIPDVVEAHLRIVDTDNDGIPNDIDVDQTGGTDDDNDGIDDNFDVTYTAGIDADNDGIDDTLKPKSDRDNDGIADYLDLDSDNDGISDTAEAGISGEDYDGDGVDDSFDVDATNGTDSNNDGIDDNATVVDTDLDGVPDLHDLDSDNDSLFDITEAGIADTDNNALIDVETALVEEPIDSDEDGIADFRDIDSDNDGVNDINTSTSVALDVDNNGIIDNTIDNDADGIDDAQDNLPNQHGTSFVENDQDNDGIPDSEEGIVDTDQDGTPNYLDEDSDNDGIPDSEEGSVDTDEDGIPDYLDEDSDNDGIPDADEGTVDTDEDGIPDYQDQDSDNDGIPDVDEGTVDTDEDGIPDYLDEDSDNDSIPDVDEGTVDTDEDGIPDYQDQDSDNDGIPDVDEGIVDTDEDGTPDYQDQDSDNDSIPDVDEGSVDTDEDGIPNYQDEDSDNDGTPDADEGTTDTDEDGIPDYIDESDTEIIANNTELDSDNDGISDIEEGNEDLDNDGIPNHLDTDSDGDGILDADENGDFNNDGINDRLQASGKVETGVKGAGSTGVFITLLLMFAVMLRQSKKRILILLAMPLLVTTNAQASDECKLGQSFANIDCWYIGAGLGYATLDPKHKNTSWRIAEDNDTAVKVFAGLALSELLFTELSYEDMGTAELHNLNPSITENLNIDYSAFGANLGFLLNERQSTWNVYAKAGVSFLDTDTGVHVEQDHGTQLTFGLGAQWNFSEKWFARIDLTAYDEDANVIGLSIARYFGSSAKASPKKKAVKKAPIRKPTPTPAPITKKVEKVVAINPDLDGDGVLNDADKCPETLANTKVNTKGCALMASITLNIQFDSWKSNVKEQYLAEIDRVAKIIDEHEDIDVVVEGHTDWQGKQDKNQVLSEARAKAVATLLEEKTPHSDKTYTTIGFGELKPIADNRTEEGRRLNRRVVVVISEK